MSVGLSSSDITAGHGQSPATSTFTSANWHLEQTVTVTGVNDAVADGTQSYTIATAAAVSGDGDYSGRHAADVTGHDHRRRRRGHHRRPGLRADDAARRPASATATFTVKLASEPTANVSVGLQFFSYITAATVSPATLTLHQRPTGIWSRR